MVSCHTVYIPETNIPDPNIFLNKRNILPCESHAYFYLSSLLYKGNYDYVALIPGSTEFGKYSTAIISIDNCLFPPQ